MKYTYEQLMEKILRAKIEIERLPKKSHVMCPADDDTGYPAACRCGADDHNKPIENALRQLKL